MSVHQPMLLLERRPDTVSVPESPWPGTKQLVEGPRNVATARIDQAASGWLCEFI